MPTFTIAVQSAVDREQRGVATSSSQFFRSIGGTMGVSVMGALMANQMTSGLKDLGQKLKDIPPETLLKFSNPQLLLAKETRETMPDAVRQGVREVLANSISWVFTCGLILVILGAVAAMFMGRERLKKEQQDSQPATEDATAQQEVERQIEMV